MNKILIIVPIILCLACQKNKFQEVVYPETILTLRENSVQTSDSIFLINSQEEYQDIINQINAIRRPGINFPPIDFSKNSLIVLNLNMENQPNSHYNINVNISNKLTILYLNPTEDAQFSDVSKDFNLIQIYKTNKINQINQLIVQ